MSKKKNKKQDAFAGGQLHAQNITEKVVGVTDGDTITVLQDRTQNKIRLYKIDAPESGGVVGTGLQSATSDLRKRTQICQKSRGRTKIEAGQKIS